MYLDDCRTPPGVRELKLTSRSTRLQSHSRTPPGVRELKLLSNCYTKSEVPRRTPPGVRELKRDHKSLKMNQHQSHPSRGA